ncbi:MAG: Nif3-like dinuclear metal center hexameric protein [Frankiales bacterium]|nr:Nif3-like dinuclear metal center hexameric protein [Frankiales bacterium]
MSTAVPSLAEVIAALDRWYPPSTAESWDAVGLTCGDPAEPAGRILLAVDCVPAVVDEAVSMGAGLLITHHPLLLSGVHGVPADDAKGSMVHRMIRAGVAHFAAHTNADIARGGVSEALAGLFSLAEVTPLVPSARASLDQLSVYAPRAAVPSLIDALTAAGAGEVGNYDRCTFTVDGTGTFRPLPGADPAIGDVGTVTSVAETRLSMVLPRAVRSRVLAAMYAAHPYEEVAFELTEQPPLPSDLGTGRIGRLAAPLPLREFTQLVAQRLPRTVWGVRAAGEPDQPVQLVAVCGGSGGGYAEAARAAGADVYLTADLKHHSTVETVTERTGTVSSYAGRPMALIDAAHWATEAPWLPVLAGRLSEEFSERLTIGVSELVTDPWTLHQPSGSAEPSSAAD